MLSIQQAGYWSKVLSNIHKNGTPISQTLSEALYRNLFIKEDFVNQCFELAALTVLSEALNGLSNIDVELLAFTADISHDSNDVFIIKAFSDPLLDSVNRYQAALSYKSESSTCEHISEGNNNDLGAMQIALSRLYSFNKAVPRNSILIVLSDGNPSANAFDSKTLLHTFVVEAMKYTRIIGIGINHDVSDIYPVSALVVHSEDIASAMFASLVRFLSEPFVPSALRPPIFQSSRI